MADLGNFCFTEIGTSDEGFSKADLAAFMLDHPIWLQRFGVLNSDDLFRRMDLNRDGICCTGEFTKWIERYHVALSADAVVCEFCERVAAEKHCCELCGTSEGHVGHDMHCTGVAVAPPGYIWEKFASADFGASLERCDLKVGDRVAATSLLKFKTVVPEGGLGTVFQLDDGILCKFDCHESLLPARVRTHQVKKVQECSEKTVAESTEQGPPWVLSVRYDGEWGERRQMEISGQWSDAYCFGGPQSWAKMFESSLPGCYNRNKHAQVDCGQDCLGRGDRCGKYHLTAEGEPTEECCIKSAWRWHLEKHRRMLQVVEDKWGLVAEQKNDLVVVADIRSEGGDVEVRIVHPPPLRFSYTGTTSTSCGRSCSITGRWNADFVQRLVEKTPVAVPA
eukprot:TRINITY_DN33723_c0_g1_i1.p1 TRINITY_DN33723_c0_g1~~TRINITY_DN33723_c0_g1_i1.p1  ORF type:complete len:393 (+),score=40.53 TRINITY_DN33723_c0_g1_i1:52-1230(+)